MTLIDAEVLLLNSRKEKVHTNFAHDNTAFLLSTRKEFVCKICNQKGHIAKYYRKTFACYSCQNTGHLKRNCKSVKTSNEEPFASSQCLLLPETLERMHL